MPSFSFMLLIIGEIFELLLRKEHLGHTVERELFCLRTIEIIKYAFKLTRFLGYFLSSAAASENRLWLCQTVTL